MKPELKISKNLKVTEDASLYDATAEQTIPLEVPKGLKIYRVAHRLKPLENKRYFQLENEAEAKRRKNLSSDIFNPAHKLWAELAIKREGYAEREDWREATHEADAVQAIGALLYAAVIPATEEEETLLDDSEDTAIPFRAMYSGTLVELTHHFREETKKEKDIFMSIMGNQPSELASAAKKSRNQRLYELGAPMITKTEGYANDIIPAWHVAKTTEAYFSQTVFERLGKPLNY
jgi:hypothetical protein